MSKIDPKVIRESVLKEIDAEVGRLVKTRPSNRKATLIQWKQGVDKKFNTEKAKVGYRRKGDKMEAIFGRKVVGSYNIKTRMVEEGESGVADANDPTITDGGSPMGGAESDGAGQVDAAGLDTDQQDTNLNNGNPEPLPDAPAAEVPTATDVSTSGDGSGDTSGSAVPAAGSEDGMLQINEEFQGVKYTKARKVEVKGIHQGDFVIIRKKGTNLVEDKGLVKGLFGRMLKLGEDRKYDVDVYDVLRAF